MSGVVEKEREKKKKCEESNIIRGAHEHVKSFSGQQNVTVSINAQDKGGI